jgi:photosynthetic reaction center cytochrome c subunit
MKLRSTQAVLGGLGIMLACLVGAVLAGGQTAPQGGPAAPGQKPLMSEEAFKNIQVLRGMPVSQFMETMGFFSASLGESCEFCHGGSDSGWDKYAEDNAIKNTARKMVLMMANINKTNFAGQRDVTCYSCHHGTDIPKVTPSLSALYGPAATEEAGDLVEKDPDGLPVDKILDKYIQALGGAQRLASISSFVAKGTTSGYGEKIEKRPIEVYAKAPDEHAVVNHTLTGDSTTVFNGREGWIAAPDTDSPVPVIALTGPDLDAIKVEAALAFPAHLKQVFSKWVVGFPNTIDNREVQVVQGISSGGTAVTFYFDSKTGLLVRQVRYTDSRIGRIPAQTDYSDYREIAGAKMPFQWTVTWLDGRSLVQLNTVQVNVPIDAAKFEKPPPPSPPAPAKAAAK